MGRSKTYWEGLTPLMHLLAQGVPPTEGAVLGAWLHGRAGEYAAEKKGRYSLLAREIADSLGYVIKELEDLDCEGVQ